MKSYAKGIIIVIGLMINAGAAGCVSSGWKHRGKKQPISSFKNQPQNKTGAPVHIR